MGYEAAGDDIDKLLKSLDDDENNHNGQISQNTKDLRKKIRDNITNPKK